MNAGQVFNASAWTPAELFANGEQGAWYDVASSSHLYQDLDGSIPVKNNGQRVGIIMDKSKGLLEGSEIILNGSFDTDAGWTYLNYPSATVDVSGGQLIVTNDSTYSVPGLRQSMITSYSAGQWFKVSVNLQHVTFGGSGGAQVDVIGSPFWSWNNRFQTNGIHTMRLRAPQSGTIRFLARMKGHISGLYTAIYNSVSMKTLAGFHLLAPNDSGRPVYSSVNGIVFDDVDDQLEAIFPHNLGSDCTIVTVDASRDLIIQDGQAIGSGTYAPPTTTWKAHIIVNRPLTPQEEVSLTEWAKSL